MARKGNTVEFSITKILYTLSFFLIVAVAMHCYIKVSIAVEYGNTEGVKDALRDVRRLIITLLSFIALFAISYVLSPRLWDDNGLSQLERLKVDCVPEVPAPVYTGSGYTPLEPIIRCSK